MLDDALSDRSRRMRMGETPSREAFDASSRAVRVRKGEQRAARARSPGEVRPGVPGDRRGHSLIPMMKLRLARPDVLIDINGLEELSFLGVEDDVLVIGALVRHAQFLADPAVGRYFPIFHDAERVIADPVVRNRGTVGGSLCQADPRRTCRPPSPRSGPRR
nr:hypothetical protein GCM10020093_039690 [Planobispora longispora]